MLSEDNYCFEHNSHHGVLKITCSDCYVEKIEQENEKLKAEIEELKSTCGRSLGRIYEVEFENNKLRELVKEAFPWVDSYHRSRHHTDLNNGQNYARVDWLEKAKAVFDK